MDGVVPVVIAAATPIFLAIMGSTWWLSSRISSFGTRLNSHEDRIEHNEKKLNGHIDFHLEKGD